MNRKWTTWCSLKSVLLVIWSSVVLIGCASVEQAAPVVAAPDKTQTKEMISNQLDQAQLLLASEQYNEAYTLFRGILVTDPENSVAILGIAEIQLTVGNYDHARSGFELVSASTEHRPQGLQGMGIALLADEKYDMAGEVLQQAVREDSTLWRAWTALGQIYDSRRDWKNARRSHDAAVAANNRSMIVHNNRGISLLLQGLYSDAASAFTHALTISPDMKNSEIARANLRLALAWQGQYMEALSGLRDYETPVALNNIGYIAMLRGDYEKAEAYLTRAVDKNPRFYHIASQNLKRLENQRAPRLEKRSASN